MDTNNNVFSYAHESFAETANALLRAQTGRPKPSYAGLVRAAVQRGWPYTPQYLSQMLSGDRAPTMEAMEIVAPLLGVRPDYFREYRVERVRRWFIEHPALDDHFYEQIAAFVAGVVPQRAPHPGALR
ncbi:MAG: helix-turn-helix transcriptional regulator [Gaiellales bacterium]|nr:helix-turn-helix transcriptional regulator [Gaiellales bacterium]